MKKILTNEWTKTVIICILLIILLKGFFLIYIVSGESMYPTLKNHNLGLAIRTTITDIERNDIVIVKENNRFIIKRVIGLPGEKIEYKNNVLYINGKEYKDKFSNITDDYTVIVDANEYFCLGDNRLNSMDSRMLGCFSKSSIKAVAIKK